MKRPTKYDVLANSIAQVYAHANTSVIASKRRVLEFEAEEVDKSIVALTATLTDAKERRNKLWAQITGLSAVINRR